MRAGFGPYAPGRASQAARQRAEGLLNTLPLCPRSGPRADKAQCGATSNASVPWLPLLPSKRYPPADGWFLASLQDDHRMTLPARLQKAVFVGKPMFYCSRALVSGAKPG